VIGRIALAIVVAAALAHAWLHARAGLSLPIPWPDEAHFLWPARSLAAHGTLAAPELHPDRALHWMPPTYSVLLAGVFTVTGPSLIVARHVSALCVLTAAGLLATLPRRPLVGSVVAALWLLHPAVIAVGNVARMEALLLALVLAGFVALDRDRAPLGLAALALAAAVHPNGFVFAVAAVIWLGATRTRVRPRDALERVALALGMLAFAAAWIVTVTGDGFADDVRYQLARKADRDLLSPWLDRRALVAFLTTATLLLPERRRERGLLLAAALAALVVRNVGREMWYAAFDPLFYGLTAFALLDAAHTLRRGIAPTIAVAIALALTAWPERPALHWRGMTLHAAPYVTPDTRHHVADTLRGRGTIEVIPHGDAALFLDRHDVAFVDPVRHPFTPDATLLHLSDQQPRHVQADVRDRLAAAPQAESLAEGWWLLR
jgi:hypothetical protein